MGQLGSCITNNERNQKSLGERTVSVISNAANSSLVMESGFRFLYRWLLSPHSSTAIRSPPQIYTWEAGSEGDNLDGLPMSLKPFSMSTTHLMYRICTCIYSHSFLVKDHGS